MSSPAPGPSALPTFADVEAAARRIEGRVMRTPLIEVPVPMLVAGAGRVFIKAECLQPMGAFKLRGALNAIALIPEETRKAGVVACSSGNHAQGIAMAARMFGIPSTIVMPHDSPAVKMTRTREFGARVIGYDRQTEDREAIARAVSVETGATFVHPYDDAGVVCGQGTIGLEIRSDLAALGLKADRILTPASGGGLAGGVALSSPGVEVVTAEPEGFDDMARSLASGEVQKNRLLSGSIADALMAPSPGRIGFGLLKAAGATGVSVSEDEMLAAIAFLIRRVRLVAEPGGAAAFAAVLAGKVAFEGITVAVVSGGNVDDEILIRALKG